MATSVVHFQGKFKDYDDGAKVVYCRRFAGRPAFGLMTEDKSKVTCSRCAKALDIPVAEATPSSTAGTCQCCFNNFETRQDKDGQWRMVLHGYQRPGWGEILGRCAGVGHLPFQLSCEETKAWLAYVQRQLPVTKAHRADLLADKVPTLLAEVRTEERRRGHRGLFEQKTKLIDVPLGAPRTQNPFIPKHSWETVPAYNELRDIEVRNYDLAISGMVSTIKFLKGKIASWKLETFPFPKAE